MLPSCADVPPGRANAPTLTATRHTNYYSKTCMAQPALTERGAATMPLRLLLPDALVLARMLQQAVYLACQASTMPATVAIRQRCSTMSAASGTSHADSGLATCWSISPFGWLLNCYAMSHDPNSLGLTKLMRLETPNGAISGYNAEEGRLKLHSSCSKSSRCNGDRVCQLPYIRRLTVLAWP